MDSTEASLPGKGTGSSVCRQFVHDMGIDNSHVDAMKKECLPILLSLTEDIIVLY